jgi:cellulose synthase/poly-beta-1,6-N-acetylglucosamine synthase-like glycosyltransferase
MLELLYFALLCVLVVVYVWSMYNLPIFAAGVRNLRKAKREGDGKQVENGVLPAFSIVVPVKNERKVIERLLDSLSRLKYPAEKVEVIIVEDGSTDGTLDICREYAAQNGNRVKILHKPTSSGKPSALNYAIREAKGDIIGIFDADNVPSEDALVKVCKYFEDAEVAAVQGRTMSINSQENMLTKFIAHEETVWCEAYLRGKDVLKLFVHLKGSCEFIRRKVLESLKGFDEEYLSDDMEFSARLTGGNFKIRYAPDVRSWQESPSSLKQLFKQRTRWYRGTMQVAFRYGRLMSSLSMRRLDAELTLFGPLILIASLVTYFSAFYAAFVPVSMSFLLQYIMQFTVAITTATLLVCGCALIYASKPRRAKSLLWLPFIYFYWSSQVFIALYAALLIVLRRPQEWLKTDKNGFTDSNLQFGA